MPGTFLWLWDDGAGEWVKAACDENGKIEVSGLDFPDDYPLPAAQVADLKIITEAPDPEISQPTPENLKHVPHGRVAGNGAYLPFQVSAAGKLAIEMTPLAHKDSHDPEDGSDPLDTAAPVKVGAANAEGNAHEFARANHVHEREHAKYTDVAADAAAKTVKLDDFTAPDDTVDLDAAAAKHGLMPKNDKIKIDTVATNADVTGSNPPQAHKDLHDPEDGSDPLDTATPGAIDENANAEGSAHSLARSDHNHQHTAALHQNGGGAQISVAGLSGVLADDQHIIDAEAVDAIEADDNLPVASITFIIDGGGSAITTGIKGALEIPFACTINRWTLLGDQSGSIQVNIWKQAYAQYPPEVGEKITGDLPPKIEGAFMGQSATLTGWTTAITAGDCLMFNVDSITDIERVTISLKVTKT